MEQIKFKSPDGKGYFNLIDMGNLEYGNPITFYSTAFINFYVASARSVLELDKKMKIPSDMLDRILNKMAIKEWYSIYKEDMDIPIPEELIQLLETTKKNDQLKLLKGLTIRSSVMHSFFYKAFLHHGFMFSNYSFDHTPTGINKMEMPIFSYKEDNNTITKVGNTTLTDGQIRSAIDQRHVIVAKFLDKDDIWHCFFTTYKSLKGEENGGRPHYHYISSGFGRSREEVLEQLSNKNYKLPMMPHIDFLREE